jgi:hypothetical protein
MPRRPPIEELRRRCLCTVIVAKRGKGKSRLKFTVYTWMEALGEWQRTMNNVTITPDVIYAPDGFPQLINHNSETTYGTNTPILADRLPDLVSNGAPHKPDVKEILTSHFPAPTKWTASQFFGASVFGVAALTMMLSLRSGKEDRASRGRKRARAMREEEEYDVQPPYNTEVPIERYEDPYAPDYEEGPTLAKRYRQQMYNARNQLWDEGDDGFIDDEYYERSPRTLRHSRREDEYY